MGKISIEESGMKFREYDERDVFHIETSQQYIETLRDRGIKICEFLLSTGNKIVFVEAKTNFPNHLNVKDYECFIGEVVQKMSNSLSLYGNILLGRYSDDGVPENLSVKAFLKKQIIFLLLVKEAKEEWLINVRDDLNSRMNDIMRIWKIQRIMVLNEEMARQKNIYSRKLYFLVISLRTDRILWYCIYFEIPFSSVVEVISNSRMSAAD